MVKAALLPNNAFDDTVIQRLDDGQSITVRDLRGLFNKGLNTRGIVRLRPDIKPRTVALARAFLIAADPAFYNEFVANLPPEKFSVLIDECLSATDMIPGVHSILGHSVHTNHVQLNGCGDAGVGDEPVWRWAVNNGYDAILTLDSKEGNEAKDLTAIAVKDAKTVLDRMEESNADRVQVDELPIIVRFRIPADGQRSQNALKALVKNQDAVRSYLDTRTAPYIDVMQGHVRAKRTYTELYAEVLRDKGRNGHLMTRRDSWIETWMDRILRGRPRRQDLTFSDLKQVEGMVRAAAAYCSESRDKKDGHVYGYDLP